MKQSKKKTLIHGIVTISIGLVVFLLGPIEFRGFPVNASVGVIILAFGVLYIILGLKKQTFHNDQNDKSTNP